MAYTAQILDDILNESLSSLSLRADPSPNPDPLPEPDELERIIRENLRPYLSNCQTITRLSPEDPYFQPARDLWEREGWDGEGLSNYINLLCGILIFPAILLLNPSNWDRLPWDEMVSRSPTLSWLQEVLMVFGFTLRDIVIIDAFPMLTDGKVDAMEAEEKRRLSNEVFNLTANFLRQFKPPIIISCQCATKPEHPRWGSVNDPLAALLRSSVSGAQSRMVTRVTLDDHVIRVVQGFHPMHIEYENNPERRLNLDQVLRDILGSIYQPCADWRDQREQKCAEDLDTAAEGVNTTVAAFLDSIAQYREAQHRAAAFGMVSSPPRNYLTSNLVRFKFGVRSFVADMLRER
jgi:hypothetical protein